MQNSMISSRDYEKLLEMAYRLTQSYQNFRENTIHTVSELFGFENITFLNAKKGKIYDPIGINATSSLCKIYDSFYKQSDMFCTDINAGPADKLIKIDHFMTLSEFEKTPYYNDFLRTGKLYYEIAVPLKAGNQVIGAMGFFHEKSDGDFSQRDCRILNYISDFVSLNYSNALRFEESQKNKIITTSDIKKVSCLTERESEIVALVEAGLSNKQISEQLQISFHTVKTHMEQIFSKLNVNNRTAMLYRYHQLLSDNHIIMQ